MNHEPHDHDGGLGADLDLIGRRLVARRSALAFLGGAAAALPAWSAARAAGSCVAFASETEGPFPADGTNRAPGPVSNALAQSGVIRRDIRPGFLAGGGSADGVKVQLDLTVARAGGDCAPLAGCAVYVWHCDRDGLYSLYTAPQESYLRGVQVADDEGRVSFVTIFPGCYPGRWPHVHLEVYATLSSAKAGARPLLTSQLAMPADACRAVYARAKGYAASASTLAGVSLADDGVFADNEAAEIAAMTPVVTPIMAGDVASGYAASARVGIPG